MISTTANIRILTTGRWKRRILNGIRYAAFMLPLIIICGFPFVLAERNQTTKWSPAQTEFPCRLARLMGDKRKHQVHSCMILRFNYIRNHDANR